MIKDLFQVGSFQLYVEDYVDADVFLKQLEQNTLSEEMMTKFQRQFEKLVVLDYIIRNTGKYMIHSIWENIYFEPWILIYWQLIESTD